MNKIKLLSVMMKNNADMVYVTILEIEEDYKRY